MFQFAATGGFAGTRVILKDTVQNLSEDCRLSFTSLMAHYGTAAAEKDWLRAAGFAPNQSGQPGLVALGKCVIVHPRSLPYLAVPRRCVKGPGNETKFVDGAQSVAPL